MRLCTFVLPSSAFLLAASVFLPAAASAANCDTATHLRACSYEAVNGSCTVTIDRNHPITPPTIYVRQRECVKVEVRNLSPFESLSLDLKSIAPAAPADQIANGFTSITTAIGSLSAITTTAISADAVPTSVAVGAKYSLTLQGSQISALANGTVSVPKRFAKELQDAFDNASSLESQHQISHAEAQTRIQEKFNQVQLQLPTFEKLNSELDAYSKALQSPLVPDPLADPGVEEILKQVHQLVQPLSPQLCRSFTTVTCPYAPKTGTWDLGPWKAYVDNQIEAATRKLKPADDISQSPRIKNKELEKDINDFAVSPGGSQPEIDVLNKKLSALNAALSAFVQTENRLFDLKKAIDAFNSPTPNQTVSESFSITDEPASENNIDVIIKTLNATSGLTAITKRLSADKYQDENAYTLANIGNTDSQLAITNITVQFEKQTWIEVSSGIVFPVSPYHSYTTYQPYSTTACTTNCTLVQENKTLSVTPVVVGNMRLTNDLIWPGHQRSSLFLTLGAGYNSAVSAPAFVGGMSFSYRLLVLNFLADVSQDTHLTGGYTVNGNLYGASAPTTKTFYGAKFAPGISIRIPLNGTSQ